MKNTTKPTLLVMAAGVGSRYGGVKQIAAVGKNNEALLDYSIYDAVNAGFGKVVFVIRKDIEKDFRERLFDRIVLNTDADYVFQEKTTLIPQKYISLADNRQKPWGTVQCVLAAAKYLDNSFVTLNSDDFYGRDAFDVAVKHFSATDENMLVGYRLSNTLSSEGGVTRGLCKVDGGYLSGLEETFNIRLESGKVKAQNENGDELMLKGDETASMNFFGFNTDFLSFLDKYWASFLGSYASDPKKECILPNAVGEMLNEGKSRVKVLKTDGKWFGMTYPKDRDTVHNEILSLIDKGVYPDRLWEREK